MEVVVGVGRLAKKGWHPEVKHKKQCVEEPSLHVNSWLV